jgi:hypothetical protein
MRIVDVLWELVKERGQRVVADPVLPGVAGDHGRQ